MRMEEHLLQSATGECARRAWALAGERPLHVFLDAEFYLNRMDILPALRGKRCVFVSHENAEERHYDLACNPRYAEFIAYDVLAWAGGTANGNLICGLSLSGLAATHIALLYPDLFPYCLSQSGSFWWNDEWLTSQVTAPIKGKFWLSVGDKETDEGISHEPTGLRQDVSQVASVQRMAETLSKAGAEVRHRVFEGGHEMPPWEKELPEALAWLLN
jgi:iron(III)-enterobactin esterase